MRIYKNTRNPILPLDIHIPDGEAHVMPDGKLYIYGSYDDRADTYCSDRYHVVSTGDMEYWTIHDKSFEGKEVPWFQDLNSVKYMGIDWSRPTPFLMKMQRNDNPAPMIMEYERKNIERKREKLISDNVKPAYLYAPDALSLIHI